MVYPAGQGVSAVQNIAPAAEIIGQMMSHAYQVLESAQLLR
jgi:hypothetical protein